MIFTGIPLHGVTMIEHIPDKKGGPPELKERKTMTKGEGEEIFLKWTQSSVQAKQGSI